MCFPCGNPFALPATRCALNYKRTLAVGGGEKILSLGRMPIYSGVETPLLPKSMTAPLMVLRNISTHIHAHPHHRHPLFLFLLLERTGCEKRDEKISSRSNDPWVNPVRKVAVDGPWDLAFAGKSKGK